MIKIVNKTTTFLLFLCFFVSVFFSPFVFAADEGQQLTDLESKIKEYTSKISEAQSQQKTLANTIQVLDNQIYLTTAQISKTQQDIEVLTDEIKDLSKKIVVLDDTLVATSQILNERIQETYKRSFLPSVYLLLTVDDFSDLFSRVKYLQVAQKNDKELMFKMEEAKANFDNQKNLKQEKQDKLEKLEVTLQEQNASLDNQKAVKKDLLVATQNDEKKFQQLLANARAEYEAIQAIISRRGQEAAGGDVKQGDAIAMVIYGKSCNSNGTHLHFMVVDQSGNTLNPFSYLTGIDHENCSGGGECNSGDPFNPSGDWDWPLNGPISFSQGYGSTWAVNNTWVGQIYRFHNGIDIRGSFSVVKAVKDGKLFRGHYTGSGGCALNYVRLEHEDSDLETYYLHIQ